MRLTSLVLMVLIGACASAEEDVGVRACTKIGCSNGLAVEVTHSSSVAINVSVRNGTQVLRMFRCDAGQTCRAFLENQTPADVTVVVDAGGKEVSKSFRPAYRAQRPNGPDCEPVCNQATVEVTVS
jgi:hypothetical protein